MEILVERKIFTSSSTISEVSIAGRSMGFILEDTDRGLTSDMKDSEIALKKIHGKTAIPTGTYAVVVDFSSRFQKRLPLLLNVRGFAGIRIHVGNYDRDTDGCLLPGMSYSQNMVASSKIAFANLFQAIQDAIATEKVYLTIKRDLTAYNKFLDARKVITA